MVVANVHKIYDRSRVINFISQVQVQNQILTHTTTGMNPESIMLNARSQSKLTTCYMISFIQNE